MTLRDGCTIDKLCYLVCQLQEGVNTNEKGSICGTIKSENTPTPGVYMIPDILQLGTVSFSFKCSSKYLGICISFTDMVITRSACTSAQP